MSRRTRPPPWHSRRWEANLSQLHSKYARSDTENLSELTFVRDAALRDELLTRGVPQTEVDALIRRHLTPQLPCSWCRQTALPADFPSLPGRADCCCTPWRRRRIYKLCNV